jgi:hypothetical protein
MKQKLSGRGIDMAKQVLNLVGMHVHGTIVVCQRPYQDLREGTCDKI